MSNPIGIKEIKMKQQTSNYSGKIVSILLLLLLCTMGSGCTSLEVMRQEQCDTVMSAPLAPEQARVCFARISNLLGAVVPHYVMDSGSNIQFDSKVIEKGQILFLDDNKIRITETQKVEAENTDQGNYVYFLVLPTNVSGKELTLKLNAGRRFNDDQLLRALSEIMPNARYVGSVLSGESIVFDRPAGTMQLKVITTGGDEAFAPNFQIEAGKKYFVSYSYAFSGVGFALSECPVGALRSKAR